MLRPGEMQHMLIEAQTEKIVVEIEKPNAEQRLTRVKGTVDSNYSSVQQSPGWFGYWFWRREGLSGAPI